MKRDNTKYWEVFIDNSYYEMWAVRPKGDRDFNSPRLFHFALEEDALKFKELAEIAFMAIPVTPQTEENGKQI
jgi:hypothetical protein